MDAKPDQKTDNYLSELSPHKKDKFTNYNRISNLYLSSLAANNLKILVNVKSNIILLRGYYNIDGRLIYKYYCSYYNISLVHSESAMRIICGNVLRELNKQNYGILFWVNLLLICDFTGVSYEDMVSSNKLSEHSIDFNSPLAKEMAKDNNPGLVNRSFNKAGIKPYKNESLFKIASE